MKKHKFVILGGGPGGLQLAYDLQQQNADYLVIEGADAPGNSFKLFPRHRKLISINKVFTGSKDPEFNMRHDWNSLLCDDDDFRFKNYDKDFFPHADSLLAYLADFVERFDINIQYNTRAGLIDKKADGYIITDQNGNEIHCEVLIVATGLDRANIPQVEGIEYTEDYADMSLDLADYEDKRVLIIGKKNSAFETADHLIPAAAMIHLVSPNSINMAWKTHYVGDLRAVNNNFLDTYQLKSQNAILDADISSIKKQGEQLLVTFKYHHAENEVESILYDKVITCTGFKFDASIFADSLELKLAYKGKYPALKNNFESVNNDNLFFAGTLTHSLDYKKSTSGFIHGFRYNSKVLAKILTEKYLGKAQAQETLNTEAQCIADHMLKRINRSGGLWQQPGFIADAAILDNGCFRYIKESQKDYLVERYGQTEKSLFVLTLEYGAPIVGDPFAVERIHRENIDAAASSQFLHPVVRHYRNGEMLAKHDVIEDLEAQWVEPEHYEPLIEFFNQQYAQKHNTDNELAAPLEV
ncbi:NAD(P)-binding domain-containing protein [Thalassomonas viridans]|uniref:NAD(P)-binding domain-containing protein n=2 Tax=Thalassomonas viridans TaxID=137584 RepID=A0AAF0CFR8_9GAMM|nr:NAD(P)-binding domain-containing protein [Thalassomonas viridans]